jgi:hypothetical protein
MLAYLRAELKVDENGDPVGAQPSTVWEDGYCAGVRYVYRILKIVAPPQHVEAAQRDAVLEEVIEALEARAKDRSEMASRGDEGAAYEADWTRSLYPLIRALKGNADLQDVVVASGRSEGIPAPAESASRVETRACYRECKGPISEGCEYPNCLEDQQSISQKQSDRGVDLQGNRRGSER